MWLTLRQLVSGDLTFPSGLRVRVCENPVVVAAAADSWGPSCAPLICLSGFPNHAALKLLSHLCERDADVLYHGDFDWAGIRIANKLGETVSFRPWRFGAADYQAAVAASSEPLELRGRPVRAVWDPDLDHAMAQAGMAVEEEMVLDDLLADLRGD